MEPELPGHWVDRDADAPGRTYPEPRGWLREAVAIAEALFEDEAGPPPEQRLRWLAAELDDFTRRIGPRSRLVVRSAFLAVSALAPVVSGRGRSLSRLSLSERGRALERFERSPLALAAFAVRATLCFLWYEHPHNARAIGIRPRPAPPRRWPGEPKDEA